MLFQTSVLLGIFILNGAKAAAIEPSCKAYPGTATWPHNSLWAALNTTVHGRLDAVVPPGAICHNSFNGVSTLNTATCDKLEADFAVNQSILYALLRFHLKYLGLI